MLPRYEKRNTLYKGLGGLLENVHMLENVFCKSERMIRGGDYIQT